MATSTFRADIATGLKTVLDAFKTANPTLLRHTFTARPPGFTGDYPIAYVETRPESIVHDAQTRTRTMTPSVVVIDQLTDNAETMARFDVLVDKLVDHFTSYPHIIPGTVWNRMAVSDEQEDLGTSVRQAVRFTFGDISIQEGRL